MSQKPVFFVVNGDLADRENLEVDTIIVSYKERYLYLGAWFTDSGKITDIISMHEGRSEQVVNKFAIFCAANSQMPYIYKKRVFDAAVMSSLLYSCESWITKNFKGMQRQYDKLVRCLLGVRKNTSISLCMLEAGITPLKNIILNKQKCFLISKRENRDIEIPFNYVYDMCRHNSTPGYRFLSNILEQDTHPDSLQHIEDEVRLRAEHSSKFNVYLSELNPSLSVHDIYTTTKFIPDYCRVSFSRLRLMSHNLRVETGRWSRTPLNERVCPCDRTSVQSEIHVLIFCPLSHHCRLRFEMLNFTSISSLMNEKVNITALCEYIHEVLSIY